MLRVANDVADLVFSRTCAGCDRLGEILCRRCVRALRAEPRIIKTIDLTGIHAGLHIPVGSALPYFGVARSAISDYKNGPNPGLVAHLGAPLAEAIRLILKRVNKRPGDVVVVPVPSRRSSIRRRGFDPVAKLLAATHSGDDTFRLQPVLRDVRRSGSTRRLSARERQGRARGAFEVRFDLPPRPCIIVDDVVTTGATIHEAAATLVIQGSELVGIATLAYTPND